MTTSEIIFSAAVFLWFASEIYYKQKLKSVGNAAKKDHSTLNILWIVILPSVFISVYISDKILLPISTNQMIQLAGIFLIFLGVVIRFMIIQSLGKYFTVDVSIRQDHQVKKDGFYRYVRHPSYTMALTSFLGLGLYLNNWLSLAIAFVPVFCAFLYRIKIEERVLTNQFGEEYLQYKKSSKMLIPYLF
jgi:protein-S-isoprenylcysteine O-methyltransferase Ste14